jgi:hypothetical protein
LFAWLQRVQHVSRGNHADPFVRVTLDHRYVVCAAVQPQHDLDWWCASMHDVLRLHHRLARGRSDHAAHLLLQVLDSVGGETQIVESEADQRPWAAVRRHHRRLAGR